MFSMFKVGPSHCGRFLEKPRLRQASERAESKGKEININPSLAEHSINLICKAVLDSKKPFCIFISTYLSITSKLRRLDSKLKIPSRHLLKACSIKMSCTKDAASKTCLVRALLFFFSPFSLAPSGSIKWLTIPKIKISTPASLPKFMNVSNDLHFQGVNAERSISPRFIHSVSVCIGGIKHV